MELRSLSLRGSACELLGTSWVNKFQYRKCMVGVEMERRCSSICSSSKVKHSKIHGTPCHRPTVHLSTANYIRSFNLCGLFVNLLVTLSLVSFDISCVVTFLDLTDKICQAISLVSHYWITCSKIAKDLQAISPVSKTSTTILWSCYG
jgi:hypothetical protein